MKLIIDIAKETYVNVKSIGLFLCPRDKNELEKAIKYAIPYEERPQGEWEENENGTGICSNCYEGIYYRTPTGRVYMMLKEQIVKFGYKYCPNCGAKMRGNKNEQ